MGIFTYQSVFCFILSLKSPIFKTRRKRAVKKTLLLVVYPLPLHGAIDIRYGVGVDCLFRVGRLAMP